MVDGPKILIVEDELEIRRFLRASLANHGYRLIESGTGRDALLQASTAQPDLVILDLGLPDMDGMAVLQQLRRKHTCGLLVVTGRADTHDRVMGLELGADDYVVKPFAVRELIARVRALQRRAEARPGDGLTLGRLRLDVAARGAFIDGKRVALSLREFTVLQYLVGKAGKVVSREQITALVEGWNAATTDNALDLLASRLRAKIEPAGLVLRTVRGLGYLIDVAEAS